MSNKSRTIAQSRDKQKKNRLIFNELTELLAGAGYEVRREKLHRGRDWRVSSGSCTLRGENLILVDRRIPEDEQLAFLIGEFLKLDIAIDSSTTSLPEELVEQLTVN